MQRFKALENHELLKKSGRPVFPPAPLAFVEEMMLRNAWEPHNKKLAPAKRKAFFSKPGPAQCQALRPNTTPGSLFSKAPACRFVVRNDTEPGAISMNVWLESNNYLYSLATWVTDESLVNFFARVPSLAVLSARTDQPVRRVAGRKNESVSKRSVAAATALTLPTYELKLPSGLSLMSARAERSHVKYDLYGKRPAIGGFEDDYLLAITTLDQVVMPPDYDSYATEQLTKVSKALGFTKKSSAAEIEALSLNRKPARILSAFGQDKKGRNVLALLTVVFDNDRVHVIMQIADGKDPVTSYKDYKSLLSGFKRKRERPL